MQHPRTRTSWNALVAFTLAIVGTMVASVQTARAGDVKQANALYADVLPNLRSDVVLLPLIASMAPPPKQVASREASAILLSGMQGFDEAAAWAQGDPQKAVLAGLKSVTQQMEFRKAFAFAQPYGTDDVDPKLVRANLFTDLGDPALLPGARFHYLAGLDNLLCLANVEANRLLAEKKAADAVVLQTDVLFFARQMCDRQFFEEAMWGLKAYNDANERLRDVIFLGLKAKDPSLTTKVLTDLLARMNVDNANTAYIELDRMRFPQADLIGLEQVLDRMFGSDDRPDPAQFPATLAKLGSSARPLRLFSEAGKWATATAGHAEKADTLNMGRRVYRDWSSRWPLPWFDRQLSRTLEYTSLDRTKYAAVAAVLPNMFELVPVRQMARVEAAGTRTIAGLVASIISRGSIPRVVAAIRPEWVTHIDLDPFSPEAARGSNVPLRYYIPPQRGQELVIVLPSESTFRVLLKDDTFVLYSVGPDYSDQKATRVQNTARKLELPADYLVWPPVLTLQRQSLVDLGQLK